MSDEHRTPTTRNTKTPAQVIAAQRTAAELQKRGRPGTKTLARPQAALREALAAAPATPQLPIADTRDC